MTRKVKVVKHLTDKGYPVHNKNYQYAHNKANKAEKRADPKAYNQLKKLEKKLGKHELMGKHTKKGKIEVEKKFARNKRLKRNIVKHEIVEKKYE